MALNPPMLGQRTIFQTERWFFIIRIFDFIGQLPSNSITFDDACLWEMDIGID
jgi:hypothetical protein